MLKLEIVLRNEAKVIRTDVLEGANPSVFFRKSADKFACLHLEMPLRIQGVEVADHFVDLEVLRLLELLQVSLCDLDFVGKWLWKRKSIFASFPFRGH